MHKAKLLDCLSRISKESDGKAFKELYHSYFRRLFRFCLTMVRSKESAEEIVHDVFLYLWEKREQSHQIANPEVYLFTAVRNKSLDHLNRIRRNETIDISSIGTEYLTFDIDPERLMITEEMKKKIQQTIDRLPPRCKHIFMLVKEDGLKYKEVASLLNLSVKTVEAQMSIALKKLMTAILLHTKEDSFQKDRRIVQ